MAQPIQSYRRQVRGGWDNEETPFVLAMAEPLGVEIMKKLEVESVFELEPHGKLSIDAYLIKVFY